MNRLGYLAAAGAVAALLTTGGAALAQGDAAAGPRRGGPGGPAGFGRLGGPGVGLPLRELNLSEAQQQQIRGVEQRYREQNQQLAERVRNAADAQRKAIETEPVNENAIRSTTQALADVEADAAIARARLRSEIFSLLTPEQQAQAKQLEAARPGREGRRGERPNHPQP
jgi:Spy/CpxP family protein refolding chaperone